MGGKRVEDGFETIDGAATLLVEAEPPIDASMRAAPVLGMLVLRLPAGDMGLDATPPGGIPVPRA